MKKFISLSCVVLASFVLVACTKQPPSLTEFDQNIPVPTPQPYPLSIDALKQRTYPGSQINIESELPGAANYTQYLTSYESDGLKIYALLTIPKGTPPEGGWPTIIFNHGYIPPDQYQTTVRYEAYVAGFAKQGFVVFKPDYRGHGDSEGQPTGAYFSPGYTIDVLNALASVRQLKEVNKDRVGMWGHSMGGSITLRAIQVDPSIKAAVIWGGVVADYPGYPPGSRRTQPFQLSAREQNASRSGRAQFLEQYGTPEQNPTFWKSVSPWADLAELKTPIQLHHAKGDETVPYEFSQQLYDQLQSLGKDSQLFLYEGSNHNLSTVFNLAMSRSVAFFKAHL